MQKTNKDTASHKDKASDESAQRIAKYLARAGVASRRDAEKLILEGRIKVNGKTLDTPAFKVTDKDKVLFDDKPVAAKQPARLWRYHKPTGLVTSHRDEKGRETVFDTLPKELGRVISIGRLDLNSEGLLLLTNDGELARKLEHPKTGFSRRYRARAYGRVTQDQLDTLQDGIKIDGIMTGPIEAMLDSQKGDNCWVSVTIREGKNREVRRAMEHLGLRVNRLIRLTLCQRRGQRGTGAGSHNTGSHNTVRLGAEKLATARVMPPRPRKAAGNSRKLRQKSHLLAGGGRQAQKLHLKAGNTHPARIRTLAVLNPQARKAALIMRGPSVLGLDDENSFRLTPWPQYRHTCGP